MNAGDGNLLFESVRLKGLILPNRLALAPMTRISATPDGVPTTTMRRYYERFATGGFGLLVTEGIYTDQAYAQGYAGQPGLTDQEQALAWRTIVDAVHAAGGKIIAQLMHAGALSQVNRWRAESVGPSAVQPKGKQMALYAGRGNYRTPRAMTTSDIDEAIGGFARAAELACQVAGFDGVEIHGANGYLLDQFLTDYTNQRDDAWGGSIGHRLRLALDVAAAVRAAVGNSVPVGMRISQAKVNDFSHKWPKGRLTRMRFSDTWHNITIIANGGLHDPTRAAQALKEGADIVALGRGALANPDWPAKVARNASLLPFDANLLSPLGTIKASEISAP